ncbi:hypothetical protein IWW55_005228, partial [Coemansia sp. RSA 2706]
FGLPSDFVEALLKEFKRVLIQDPQNPRLGVTTISPSIIPKYLPAFRVFKYLKEPPSAPSHKWWHLPRGTLLDYDVFTAPLAKLNKQAAVDFSRFFGRLYRASEVYGIDDLSIDSYLKWAERLLSSNRAQNETASRPEASANMTSLAMLQAAMNNNSNSSQAPTQPTMTAQPQPAMTTQPAASMPNGMQMPQGAYYYPYMMPPMPMSGAGSPQVNGAQPPMMPNGQHMPFPMWMNPMFPPPGATPGQHAVSISMPSSPTRRNSPSAINNPGNYLSDSQMPPDRASTNRPQNRQSAAPPSYNDSIHHLLAD